ncbi:MAG: sialidase family protein [Candidatus Brocadiia bacterium]|jgi:hypothetical protein
MLSSTRILRLALGAALILPACWPSPVAFGEAAALTQPVVRTVQAPAGCFVPDVAVDPKGVLHMVYALNRNAWYIRSTDNGATFSQPVQVNSEGTVGFTMGERGPKLSVGGDGVIHVVWSNIWSPGVQTFAYYARSLDGGKTFEKRKLVSSMDAPDGLTMAADGASRVLVFWHVMNPLQNEVPAATWLYMARSDDNGDTFKTAERIKVSNLGTLACAMCQMRARVGADGNAYLTFRSAEHNIRDFYVLKGPVTSNKFTAVRVNQDNWELKTCPMCGPELTVAPDGRQICAFMTREKVYWAVSNAGVTEFELHVATPDNEAGELYPSAIANRKGEVLFVWQVGPMSTAGTATVKWARYSPDGKFTGRQGTLGRTTSGTKATEFVGSDDSFYIVTTAK